MKLMNKTSLLYLMILVIIGSMFAYKLVGKAYMSFTYPVVSSSYPEFENAK